MAQQQYYHVSNSPKRFVTKTKEDKNVFCTYQILGPEYSTPGALLLNLYFPAKGGYSLVWEGKLFYHLDGYTSKDGRKRVERFIVHPFYWAGCQLKTLKPHSLKDAISKFILTNVHVL